MKCCDLTAGMLRHKIRVMAEQRTPDGQGGFVKIWAELKNIRAKIRPLSGSESFIFDKRESKVTHKIFTRYTTGINASMRIYYRDRVFRVIAVINIDERDKWLEIHAEEYDSDKQ